MDWTSYEKRLKITGETERERTINSFKNIVSNKALSNPSCKDVKINGVDGKLTINTSTQPYYKEYETIPDQAQIELGDYVEFANSMWLVTTRDSDDELYIDGKLEECQYNLRWQNDSGDIIERWAVVYSASKYNDGETGNKMFTIGSDQLMVTMPCDEETLYMQSEKRVFIDKNIKNPTAYKLTKVDTVTSGYGNKGIVTFIANQCVTDLNKDRIDLMLCDYIDVAQVPSDTVSVTIKYNCKNVSSDGIKSKYTAVFTNEKGEKLDLVPTWTINKSFSDDLDTIIANDYILIGTTNEDLNYETFELVVSDPLGNATASITIEIEAAY